MTATLSNLIPLAGLDPDLQRALLAQVRDLWTHGSTALEGNTLTLGETKFVIEEGLTVSGKPLKDHQEVVGHARAIELVYGLLDDWPSQPVIAERLFDLHRAVQTSIVTDIYKPIGGWKLELNGGWLEADYSTSCRESARDRETRSRDPFISGRRTATGDGRASCPAALTQDGRQTFIDYAAPADVPALMDAWLAELNRLGEEPLDEDGALAAYARLHLGFVHVHPFWDGNGRLARLLANLPVLRAGHLPVVINVSERKRYIDTLAAYQLAVGPLTSATGVWPRPDLEAPFLDLCREAYAATHALIAGARAQQSKRAARSRISRDAP